MEWLYPKPELEDNIVNSCGARLNFQSNLGPGKVQGRDLFYVPSPSLNVEAAGGHPCLLAPPFLHLYPHSTSFQNLSSSLPSPILSSVSHILPLPSFSFSNFPFRPPFFVLRFGTTPDGNQNLHLALCSGVTAGVAFGMIGKYKDRPGG